MTSKRPATDSGNSREEIVGQLLKAALAERESMEFYRKAAATAGNDEARELLLTLGSDEESHWNKLREAVLKIAPGTELDAIPGRTDGILAPGNGAGAEPGWNGSMESVISVAMKAEEAAVAHYEELSTAESRPELKQMLLAMASLEAKHLRRLESLGQMISMMEGAHGSAPGEGHGHDHEHDHDGGDDRDSHEHGRRCVCKGHDGQGHDCSDKKCR